MAQYVDSRVLSACALRLIRNGAQKLLGVLITVGEAVAYVVSGMYGDVRELGAGNAILIIVQARACMRTLLLVLQHTGSSTLEADVQTALPALCQCMQMACSTPPQRNIAKRA